MEEQIYLCIDMKSFFASVECVERGLDPMTTNLVVADPSRGNGAICLAITPAMKALGIHNRCRIYEIPNSIDYITALPRMKKYMEVSANIYSTYLKYISADDIHVYSVDECFLDITSYLKPYGKSPKEMVLMLTDAVFKETGITATAGIGTNLFLAKVALDITAKHVPDHIGFLDEASFKQTIWHHKPIIDIWGVGRGISARLEKYGAYDLYDVSQLNEKLLYKEFGINAEYLIDHSKGIEPCTIKEIHDYKSKSTSLSNGQILFEDYKFEDALLVLKEMVDLLTLDLVEKHLVTNAIGLNIGYSDNLTKSTGGTRKFGDYTNSYKKIMAHFEQLYLESTKRDQPIRRINIGFSHLQDDSLETFSLFDDVEDDSKEKKLQETVISIKNKYGKNAVLKGMNYSEKATARKRNKLTGGHNSE
jgi:DNA polymerase V